MKGRIGAIIGVLLILVGAAIAFFAHFALADLTGFAVTMFGAGVAVSALWDKRDKEKPTWLTVLSIVLIGAGAFALGVCGISESLVTTVITSTFGLVAIVASIIITMLNVPKSKDVGYIEGE